VSHSPKRDLDGVVADLTSRRTSELRSKGVDFKAFASRRPLPTGLRYRLLLHVWPEDGFDDFAFDAFHRPWFGHTRAMDDVVGRADAVLDAYARGEVPPGPAFRG
jgi:hypothetical protein